MTYRKLLEKYKQNELDKEQAADVEAEIEKHEAISEYLYEDTKILGLDDDILGNKDSDVFGNTNPSAETDFTRLINQSIRKSFLKLGISVFTITVIFMLFIQFALPHIVSSFYYNPSKKVGENANQISRDMAVYTNLFVPGCVRDSVSVEENGYADYDICINQIASYNGNFTNLMGRIKKGKLILYDVNLLKRPSGNVFGWYQVQGDHSKALSELVNQTQYNMTPWGGVEQSSNYLKELDDDEMYVAYVTLNHIMKYEDFNSFLESKADIPSAWCAVDTNRFWSQSSMIQIENIGFWNTPTNFNFYSWNKERYPNLYLEDDSYEEWDELLNKFKTEAFTKEYVISLLRYMAEQKSFLKMMKESSMTLSNAADYIEKNGVSIYGFACLVDKETAIKLNNFEEVYQVYCEMLR